MQTKLEIEEANQGRVYGFWESQEKIIALLLPYYWSLGYKMQAKIKRYAEVEPIAGFGKPKVEQ